MGGRKPRSKTEKHYKMERKCNVKKKTARRGVVMETNNVWHSKRFYRALTPTIVRAQNVEWLPCVILQQTKQTGVTWYLTVA